MSEKSTLKLLDELDTFTQDFLSELNAMESKRGGPAKKATVTEQADVTDSTPEKIPSPPLSTLHACRAPPSEGPKDAEKYCMKHRRRGQCLIFVYKSYSLEMVSQGYPERSSAREDSEACEEAFKALNFEVEVFEDLKTKELQAELKKVSTRDHSDCDALVVVFMSHGDSKDGREELVTYDGQINTAELWRDIAQCPSLQGKPKLFFIQACRGHGVEKSVGLKVSTDNSSRPSPLAEWALGFDSPDLLVMQSTYEGMYSFRTSMEGKKVSIFIYFLAQILKDRGSQKDLSELLLEVTRRVAVDYEASAEGKTYDKAKQMPLTRSTLTKKITLAVA